MRTETTDIDRFYGVPKPAWTEFWKEKDLRTLIRATQKRLEELLKYPDKNKEAIMREQIVLSATQHELEQLGSRLDYF